MIRVYNRQKDLTIKAASVKRLVSFILDECKISYKEIAIYFVGKRKIEKLHDQFFQDPTPTDCITFPFDDAFLGEIFVCPKVAQEYDPKRPYLETTLYIIHGILHLLGFNDIDKKEREKMVRRQRRLLNLAIKTKCTLEALS